MWGFFLEGQICNFSSNKGHMATVSKVRRESSLTQEEENATQKRGVALKLSVQTQTPHLVLIQSRRWKKGRGSPSKPRLLQDPRQRQVSHLPPVKQLYRRCFFRPLTASPHPGHTFLHFLKLLNPQASS